VLHAVTSAPTVHVGQRGPEGWLDHRAPASQAPTMAPKRSPAELRARARPNSAVPALNFSVMVHRPRHLRDSLRRPGPNRQCAKAKAVSASRATEPFDEAVAYIASVRQERLSAIEPQIRIAAARAQRVSAARWPRHQRAPETTRGHVVESWLHRLLGRQRSRSAACRPQCLPLQQTAPPSDPHGPHTHARWLGTAGRARD